MLERPPLSLYVHIPWCVRKCPYCDFNSHEFTGALPEADYVQALCDDFDEHLQQIAGRSLHSVFIGGGTPSLFSAGAYDKLFSHLHKRITIAANAEITLEANPGTAEASRFEDYRRLGINRLSLGIQSFADKHLRKLGRIHSAEQGRQAIAMAERAGFDNFNLDIMHGLPEQTREEALADLKEAVAYAPAHLSWYQLTIEPNTVFYAKPPPLPDEADIGISQTQGQELLASRGYEQYEVSAYAAAGRQSMHNLNYWQFGDYLGIGAGAHGKLTDPDSNTIVRTRKLKQPNHYLQNSIQRLAETTPIPESERPLEFLLNTLRLRQGFTEQQFVNRTGLPFSHIAKRVEYLLSKGLMMKDPMTEDQDRFTTTARGYLLLNSVLEEFL